MFKKIREIRVARFAGGSVGWSCLAGADRADAPKRKGPSGQATSLFVPQPIEKDGFGLANCDSSTGQETARKSLRKFDGETEQAA
jgi:hypothetical protein